MHIVFVHGVAVRRDGQYEQMVQARRDAFTRLLLAGRRGTFFDPYWGDLGAPAPGTLRSVPYRPGTALALGDPTRGSAPLAPEATLHGRALVEAAATNFGGVLNSLSLTLITEGNPDAVRLAEAIGRYAASLDRPDQGGLRPPGWLGDMRNDGEFLNRLWAEADSGNVGALGLTNWLRDAGRRILGVGLNIVDGPVARLVRGFTPKIGAFLGDAFIYLQDGERRTGIRQIVTKALAEAARSARAAREPLLVVGHSMGGNILYDILRDEAECARIDEVLGAPLAIDLLLSVGTQIGLLEELGLFAGGVRASVPEHVRRWWHVFNQMDVLSFAVEGIIEGVTQFSVDTDANIVEAHSAYFISPVFQQRLRKRMIDAELLA